MTLRIAVVSLLLLLTASPVAAQTAPPDPIRELLAEVKALRTALERAATIGPRIQLLVARVQIQEQRIAELSRRADSLRSELRSIDQEIGAAEFQEKMFNDKDSPISPEDRDAMAQMLKQFAGNAERLEKRKQELILEEQMVTQQITVDQGRWNDFNNQLDQLERSLTPVRQ